MSDPLQNGNAGHLFGNSIKKKKKPVRNPGKPLPLSSYELGHSICKRIEDFDRLHQAEDNCSTMLASYCITLLRSNHRKLHFDEILKVIQWAACFNARFDLVEQDLFFLLMFVIEEKRLPCHRFLIEALQYSCYWRDKAEHECVCQTTLAFLEYCSHEKRRWPQETKIDFYNRGWVLSVLFHIGRAMPLLGNKSYNSNGMF